MKKILKLRTFVLLAALMFLVFTVTSCMIVPLGKPGKGNNGKHKGHHKSKGNKVKGKHSSQNTATPWEPIETSKV